MRPLLMPGRASLSKPQTFWRHPSKFGWHAWTEKMCFYWNISAWEKMSHGLMDQVGLQTRHVTVLCQQPASTLHMFLKAVYLCTSTWVCYSMRLSGSAPFMCTLEGLYVSAILTGARCSVPCVLFIRMICSAGCCDVAAFIIPVCNGTQRTH